MTTFPAMDDTFGIDVNYKGRELTFEGSLVAVGYTHNFLININGFDVTFEPDEERNYRAIAGDNDMPKLTDADKEIIGLISIRLEPLK